MEMPFSAQRADAAVTEARDVTLWAGGQAWQFVCHSSLAPGSRAHVNLSCVCCKVVREAVYHCLTLQCALNKILHRR